jgi:hypothetical protein
MPLYPLQTGNTAIILITGFDSNTEGSILGLNQLIVNIE